MVLYHCIIPIFVNFEAASKSFCNIFTTWSHSSILRNSLIMVGWLVGYLGFYGISTFVGYLTQNSFFMQIVSSISNNSV